MTLGTSLLPFAAAANKGLFDAKRQMAISGRSFPYHLVAARSLTVVAVVHGRKAAGSRADDERLDPKG